MIKEAILLLIEGNSLTMEQSAAVMEEIMSGQVTPAQFGAFVTALRMKGETADEIAGLASVMRSKAIRVNTSEPVVDIVGTGGDGTNTFNISTTAAFVIAGAGLKVAKHGNRAASSQCGSADVLEALGVKIDLTAEQVQRCIQEIGIGFMFAQVFHPAMKYASAPRREIGVRTVFNILGPLTNPAFSEYQVIGVPSKALGEKIALVLRRLGTKHSLVIHGVNGMDEISLTGKSLVWEIDSDEKLAPFLSYEVAPEDFGLRRAPLKAIKGGTLAENAGMLSGVLSGEKGPRRDVVLMNAAAAIMAGSQDRRISIGGRKRALKDGLELAKETIDSGVAMKKLKLLLELTSSFKEENK